MHPRCNAATTVAANGRLPVPRHFRRCASASARLEGSREVQDRPCLDSGRYGKSYRSRALRPCRPRALAVYRRPRLRPVFRLAVRVGCVRWVGRFVVGGGGVVLTAGLIVPGIGAIVLGDTRRASVRERGRENSVPGRENPARACTQRRTRTCMRCSELRGSEIPGNETTPAPALTIMNRSGVRFS